VAYRTDSGGRLATVAATSAAALAWQFVFQLAAGWYLSRAYIPNPKLAHGTMESIMGATPHSIVAGFHYWGGFLFLAHSLSHLTLMMFGGMFKPPNHWRWFTGIMFAVCAFLFQVTGTLLPFDRHGVQSAAIEGAVVASMPGGESLAALLMGGLPEFNDQTLSTWYFAHRILLPIALAIGVLASTAAFFRREAGHANKILAVLIALVPLGLAFGLGRPLGSAASTADYNQFGAMPGWYSWPLHGSLNLFNGINPALGWIGAMAIPTLFALLLLLAPILSSKLANAGIQILFLLFAGYFLVAALMFGGRPAPLTGNRDPIAQTVAAPSSEVQAIDRALAEVGRQAFNNGLCFGCHGFNGEDPSGGPNLAGVGNRISDPEWFAAFIRDPKSKKPGTTMPGFTDLDQKTVRALSEFLRSKR
jgi:quinol-cytochrome oxidoreductase complex cytochrome b subunit